MRHATASPLWLLGLVLLQACATQSSYEAGARAALQALKTELQAAPPANPAKETETEARYRLPVVSRVEVPDAIIGGVLVPRHETYVVLQPGTWVPAPAEAPAPRPAEPQSQRTTPGPKAPRDEPPAPPRPPVRGPVGGEGA